MWGQDRVKRLVGHDLDLQAAWGRASALQSAGDARQAAELWARIAAAAPQSAAARFNLGATLLAQHRFADAEAAFRAALALDPNNAAVHHRLGNLLQATGRWSEAEPCYLSSLRLDPSPWRVRLDLAHLHLGQGDFAKGWPLFEARRSLGDDHVRPPPLLNEWQGEPLRGRRVLVWPEQGFGDQIQFARFVPEIARRGADVTLVTPPELARLFESLGVRVVANEDGAEIAEPDYWTLIASLPLRLAAGEAALPASGYLQAPEAARERWRGFAPKGTVGLMWQGRATPNPHRSLPSRSLLDPLVEAGANLIDLAPPAGSDFGDTAAVVEQLDLVITVDTAVAHLAGALGKPCWVLLPWLNADWRWMQGRSDSPWYPSMRLFRQPSHGDWVSVVAEVVQAWCERDRARR